MKKSAFLIKNARIADGGCGELFTGDVSVFGTVIDRVGRKLETLPGQRSMDAEGRLLAPGFIDSHSHSDISIIASPEAFGKISQGITTEIVGNCGLSAFPVTELNSEHLDKLYSRYNVEIDWKDLKGYSEAVNLAKPAVNIVANCGHNTLRAAIAGYEDKTLGKNEIRALDSMLRKLMGDGACGISTGFLYTPGIFADDNEKAILFKAASDLDKPYVTHLRSEGDFIIEALEDTFQFARNAGKGRIHISHLKTAGKKNWSKIDDVFKTFAKYQKKDLNITADRYPYTESMTGLSAFLPEPYKSMDDVKLQKYLINKLNMADFINKIDGKDAGHINNLRLVSCGNPELKEFEGKTLTEISSLINMSVGTLTGLILRYDVSSAMASSKGMCIGNMKRILESDIVCCGTDETARPLSYEFGRSHPRGFASFPKFFNILHREIGIPETIRKMTSLSARIFNIRGRGRILPNYFADLVLLNPDHYNSHADFANPHEMSKGVVKVWVNGVESFSDGKVVGRGGHFIAVY